SSVGNCSCPLDRLQHGQRTARCLRGSFVVTDLVEKAGVAYNPSMRTAIQSHTGASGAGFVPVSEAPSFLANLVIRSTVQSPLAPLRVKEVEEQLLALRTSLICAFNQLLDLKDLNTGVHSTRLAEWALHVARGLGL